MRVKRSIQAERERIREAQYLTIRQAAILLQCDPQTVYRKAWAGLYVAVKVGREWRLDKRALLATLESARSNPS